MDNQWLIQDGVGKQGTSLSKDNYYPTGNSILDMFIIEGVGHPYSNFTPYVGNSLFVIFSDLTFCNLRRTDYCPKYFVYDQLPTGNTQHQRAHNFICRNDIDNPIYVLQGYLSNIYEGDDPPETVFVLPGNKLGTQGYGEPYVVKPTIRTDLMHANHSVAPNKDITITIDHNNIISRFGPGTYKFEFNHFRHIASGTSPSDPDFFVLSPIGNAGAVISGGSFNIKNPKGEIEIEILPDTNTFINLHPSSSSHPLFPSITVGNTDYAENLSVFKITNVITNQTFEIEEAIRLIQ